VPLRTGPVLELLPPFSIVLVTTQTNVITIGQIEYFTFSPLRIGIGVAHRRHSHGLLAKEGEFVVNVPDESLVDAVGLCGRISGRDHDKFEAAGLDREPSSEVQAVSIAQCRARIECRIERQIEFEDRTWFIAKVVAARKEEGFSGRDGLLCDRRGYLLVGRTIAQR
jgi:flavin reductase (DIM6/NTAB) family NADH-FMN oxidoreductase RutF